MADISVSLQEIREAGILLRSGAGPYVVRVLGAQKEIHLRPMPMKEKLRPLADPSVYERFYAGELPFPPADPALAPDAPHTPSLVITEAGDPVILERNLA